MSDQERLIRRPKLSAYSDSKEPALPGCAQRNCIFRGECIIGPRWRNTYGKRGYATPGGGRLLCGAMESPRRRQRPMKLVVTRRRSIIYIARCRAAARGLEGRTRAPIGYASTAHESERVQSSASIC